MNQWQSIGWLILGAAGAVAVLGGGYLLLFSDLSLPEALMIWVGLLFPLGVQTAFGLFMIRRGSDANSPND